MPQERVTQTSGGRPVGYAGASSGAGAEETARRKAEEAERQAYRKRMGASGIAGAAKANMPGFKAKEDAYIKDWRSKQAQRNGQVKAVTEAKKAEEKK